MFKNNSFDFVLGSSWGQIWQISSPFRGRPTLENRAPAYAGSELLFRPNLFRPPFRRPFGPHLGPFGGHLGPRPGPPGALLGSPGGPDLARRLPRRGLKGLLGTVLGHGLGYAARILGSMGPGL